MEHVQPDVPFARENAVLSSDRISEFSSTLRGRVVQPGDADYDTSRRVYNAMIDRFPRSLSIAATLPM